MNPLRESCGQIYNLIRDHVAGISRTYVYETSCNTSNPSAPPAVKFRYGGEADVAAFTLETHEYGAAEKKFGFERLRCGDSLLIGETNGEVVFYAWLMRGIVDLDQSVVVPVMSDVAYSYKVFTVASARGMRICGAYYNHLVKLLRQEGYRRLVCRIAPGNTPSILAHERIGFERRGCLWKLTAPGHSFYYADPAMRAWWPGVSSADCFGTRGFLCRHFQLPAALEAVERCGRQKLRHG